MKKRSLVIAGSSLLVCAVALSSGYAVYYFVNKIKPSDVNTEIPAFVANVQPAQKTYSNKVSLNSVSIYDSFAEKAAASYFLGGQAENKVYSAPDFFVESALVAFLGGEPSEAKFCDYVGAGSFNDVVLAAKEITLALGTMADGSHGGLSFQSLFSSGDSSDIVAAKSTKATSSDSFFAWILQTELSGKAIDYFLKQNGADAVGENAVPALSSSVSDVAVSSYAVVASFSKEERAAFKSQYSSGSHKMAFVGSDGLASQVDYTDRYSSALTTLSGDRYSGVYDAIGAVGVSYYLPKAGSDLSGLGSWYFDANQEKAAASGDILSPYFAVASENDLTSALAESSSLSLSDFYAAGHTVSAYYQTETLRYGYAGFGRDSFSASNDVAETNSEDTNVFALSKPFGVVTSQTVTTDQGEESLPMSFATICSPDYK
jgi:hypothetical protein